MIAAAAVVTGLDITCRYVFSPDLPAKDINSKSLTIKSSGISKKTVVVSGISPVSNTVVVKSGNMTTVSLRSSTSLDIDSY